MVPAALLIRFNNDRFLSLTDDEPPRRFAPPDEVRGTPARCYGCYDDWLLYWNPMCSPATCWAARSRSTGEAIRPLVS